MSLCIVRLKWSDKLTKNGITKYHSLVLSLSKDPDAMN